MGVYGDGGVAYLFYKTNDDELIIERSTDGHNFVLFKDKARILISGASFPLIDVESLSISRVFDNYFLSFKNKAGKTSSVFSAKGKDFDLFHVTAEINGASDDGILVPSYQVNGKYLFLSGGGNIESFTSEDFFNWDKNEKPVIESHHDFFGQNPLKSGNAFLTDEGILFIYFEVKSKDKLNHFEIRAVVLDKNNPSRVIRHVGDHIWESPDDWVNKQIAPLGLVKIADEFISFWNCDGQIFSISHPGFLFGKQNKNFPKVLLDRLKHNPLIAPIIENHWESKATFNPTAIVEKDKIHIIYRAIGDDDVSVLGYAQSSDGINIDMRHHSPIYVPTQPFESSGPYSGKRSPGEFTSGGGCWGGCEDPRITKIDDKLLYDLCCIQRMESSQSCYYFN